MGNIAEEIVTDQINRDVTPGEIIKLPVDLAFGHDVTLPPAISEFDRLDVDSVFDSDSVVVIPDHLVPAHSGHAAELYTACEEFAESHDTVFYPQGTQGQEHVVIPEDGLVAPGEVMVGADSHSCTEGAMGVYSLGVGSTDLAFAMAFGWVWARVPETVRIEYVGELADWVSGKDLALATVGELGVDGAVYEVLEFGGPAIRDLPMDDRFTLSNMAIEAGAATGIVEPDETTAAFADDHCESDYTLYTPSADATYSETVTIDCTDLEPQVAVPNLPENTKAVSAVQSAGVEIDQAVIGSCTNGRRSDLEVAAEILDGETVDDDVRLIVTPGSQELERESIEEGWTATFLDANATMENPGCGACFGMRTGVLDEDEVAVSTTNRNFTGRMGDPSSEVYLASPAVAAASAVAGEIVHPAGVA
jgi:3-isopropylmalate/(R)-2-methylmalate dehydratase large subunit